MSKIVSIVFLLGTMISTVTAQDLSGRDKQAGKDGKKAFSKGDYETAAKAYSVTSDRFRQNNPKAQYEYLFACYSSNRIMRAFEELKSNFEMKGPKKMISNEDLLAQIQDLAGQYTYAIEEGKGYLNKGDAKAALSSADFAVDIDPYYLEGHLLRGRAFIYMEKWVDATAAIQDIIDAKIPEESAFYIRAVAKMGQGNQAQGLEDLNTSIKIRPSAEASYLRGKTYVEMKQGRRGINDLFTAIRLQPDLIAANYLMGRIQLEEGDNEKAINYLTKTISLDETYEDAFFLRGEAYANTGKFLEAKNDFEKQLQLVPNDASTHFSLGTLLTERAFDTLASRNEKVVFHYDKALEYDSQNDHYYAVRAKWFSRMGNATRAVLDYNKALTINPTEFEYYSARLQAQQLGKVATNDRIKGLKEAIFIFQQETQKPRKGPGFMNLSKVYLLMNNQGVSGSWVDSALVAIDESLKESQRNADYFHQKGKVYYLGFKKYSIAEEFYKKAVDINAKDELLWLDLAKSIYNQGDIPRAIETLKGGQKKANTFKKSKLQLDEWCASHPGDC